MFGVPNSPQMQFEFAEQKNLKLTKITTIETQCFAIFFFFVPETFYGPLFWAHIRGDK